MNRKLPAVILVMGVSGSGKTTIGGMLAARLGGSFLDADAYHPVENLRKMRNGMPLDDSDRWPWLDAMADAVRDFDGPKPVVLGCSALKQAYRDRLQLEGGTVVFLQGSHDTIARRLSARREHFMPANLLRSQLETLEEPSKAITVSVDQAPDQIVDRIMESIAS